MNISLAISCVDGERERGGRGVEKGNSDMSVERTVLLKLAEVVITWILLLFAVRLYKHACTIDLLKNHPLCTAAF